MDLYGSCVLRSNDHHDILKNPALASTTFIELVIKGLENLDIEPANRLYYCGV